MARFDSYERDSQPIWATGKVTPEAKRLFQGYFIPWQTYALQLDFYEKHRLSRTGVAKVLSSEPTRIKLSETGGAITIRQCADAANSVTVTQNGAVVKPTTTSPQQRAIELNLIGGQWLILRLTESEGNKPCDG